MANQTFEGKVLQALDGKAEKDLSNVNYLTLKDVITQAVRETPSMEYLLESDSTEMSWYRLWNTGLLEQGGFVYGNGLYNYTDVTFMRNFLDTNYSLVVSADNLNDKTIFSNDDVLPTVSYLADVCGVFTNKTVSGFTISSKSRHSWYARGFVSL